MWGFNLRMTKESNQTKYYCFLYGKLILLLGLLKGKKFQKF